MFVRPDSMISPRTIHSVRRKKSATWEERVAYNEAWTRAVNERRAERMRETEPLAGFRCECWRAECAARVFLSWTEWDEARSRPNRFAVAPGHVAPEVETVVRRYPRFWLVDKFGKAGELADTLA